MPLHSAANDANHRYKKDCAGKGCINEGIHLLKIRFINKGWVFCSYCKDSLLNDNLVDQVIHNTDSIRWQKNHTLLCTDMLGR